MPKLTKTEVDGAAPGPVQKFIWDTEIKGFGLKIFPTGVKTFVFQYRIPEGKTRRTTIGRYSNTLTADQARKRAKELAYEVHAGRDPMGERKARRDALSVNELLDLYVLSEKFASNAATTQAVDRGRMDRHLRPLLGREIAANLTADQVAKARRAIAEGGTAARVKTIARGLAKVTGGPGTADKAALLLKTVFSWALENGFAKSNPVAKLRVAASGTRDTIMDGAEDYKRMFATLQKMENEKRIRAAVADAIRFIALTGARRGEVTGLIWRWVDLKTGLITLPPKAHKAGHRTGKPRIIALPAEAQAIIARQPAGEPDDHVFLPVKGAGALALDKSWAAVRTEAKLPANLGMHGLRHSIGTHLAMAGASAVELMETLGHRQITTTLRYVHFAERSRSTLATRAAAVVSAGLAQANGKPTADVVKLRRKKSPTAA